MAILEDLLKALVENTEVTKNLIALRTEAIETVKGAAASTPKASAAKATTAAAATTETAAASTTTATETPAAATTDTKVYDELAASIGAYVGGTTRDDERAARKAKIKALLQHDKIKKPGTPADVFDAANIMDDAIQLFKDNLQGLIEKGDLTEAPKSTALV